MEPDYDDLINDYVEDYEGPPPEYDDDILEEMMNEAQPASKPASTTAFSPHSVIESSMPPKQFLLKEGDHPPDFSALANDEENNQKVRDYVSRQNSDSSVYNFDR